MFYKLVEDSKRLAPNLQCHQPAQNTPLVPPAPSRRLPVDPTPNKPMDQHQTPVNPTTLYTPVDPSFTNGRYGKPVLRQLRPTG